MVKTNMYIFSKRNNNGNQKEVNIRKYIEIKKTKKTKLVNVL